MNFRSTLLAVCVAPAFTVVLPFAVVSAQEDHHEHHEMQELHGDTHMEGMHEGHDMKHMDMEHMDMEHTDMDHGSGMEMPMGRPGDAHSVTRTITITMDENLRFAPDNITVKAGETVRFFLKNSGGMKHEMVLGSLEGLRAHADMMRGMPNMEHKGPHMTQLKPGKRGAIIWHFDKPGTVYFACLVPGHMEGGMQGTINIQ